MGSSDGQPVAPMPISPADIANAQWRYVGYKGFTSFLSSDTDFLVIRRFGALNARTLLIVQDQLSELEAELATVDEKCSRDGTLHNGSFRSDSAERNPTSELEPSLGYKRSLLNAEIVTKVRLYNELVLQAQQMASSLPVADRDVSNIKNWFHNHPNAIAPEEQEYIKHSSDLMSVVPKTKTPFRRILERSTIFRTFSIWEKTPSELLSLNYSLSPQLEHFSSDERIDKVLSYIIIILGLVMLIAPIWILGYVKPVAVKLSVITVFLFGFVLLLGFATPARSFETVAAAAAYAAVLMVFLQSGS